MLDRSDTPIRQVLLVSQARGDPAQAEIAIARPDGLTGALLFSGGHFIQVIEGPPEAVTARLSEIASDGRHGQVTQLWQREVPQRRFAQWHVGRLELDGGDDLLQSLLRAATVAPERAERLLARVAAIAAAGAGLSDRV